MLFAGEVARARSAAKAAHVGRVLRPIKALPTLHTIALNDAMASTVTRDDNESLAVLNNVCPPALHIAGVTGGNEIRKRIVETVAVKMIDNERTRGGVFPGKPLDCGVAPMASMGASANGVIQDGPMLRNLGIASGERVIRRIYVGVFPHTSSLTKLEASCISHE